MFSGNINIDIIDAVATCCQEPDSGSFLGGRERVYRRARNLVIDPD